MKLKKFQHDCKSCIFINHLNGYDCYICKNEFHAGGTLVARFSDEGKDYWSMPYGMFLNLSKTEMNTGKGFMFFEDYIKSNEGKDTAMAAMWSAIHSDEFKRIV